jgi:predicted phage terminase large subunit-like protein
LLLRAGAKPGTYLCVAPTFPMLRDSALKTLLDLGKQLGLLCSFAKGDMVASLTSGSRILLRSADQPERLRGPNLSGCWMDEASLMDRDAYSIAIACLRENGQQGWLSATFTPRGRAHWTFETFGSGNTDTELFTSRTADNPFLPHDFVTKLAPQYTSSQAAQELEGRFIDAEGALFRRSWFEVVPAAPATGLRKARGWDFAASAPRPGGDPDFTVGALLGRTEAGLFYVLDVVRVRQGPAQVEQLLQQTAELDGPDVRTVLEVEPGSAGKALADRFVRLLAGHNVATVRPTGDKATRAMPFAAQAEHGSVKVVHGAWTENLLRELESFPVSGHDDQVDAVSLAFSDLAAKRGFWMRMGGEVFDFSGQEPKPKQPPPVEVTEEVSEYGRSTIVKLNKYRNVDCTPGSPGWAPVRRPYGWW